MSVIMKEAMRRNKRRVPVDHSPESRAQNYSLVFNQKGEVFTPFREVNLAMPSDKCTKDTSHAFFCLRKLIIAHKHITFSSWQATSEPSLSCDKKPRAQVSGVSLLTWNMEECLDNRIFPMRLGLFKFSHCKGTTELRKLLFPLREISKFA